MQSACPHISMRAGLKRAGAAIAGSMLLILSVTPAMSQDPPDDVPATVPFAEQRRGDPATGYSDLISKGWVGCGIPALYYDIARALLPNALWP